MTVVVAAMDGGEMGTETAELAERIVDLAYGDLPDEVVAVTEHCVLDVVGLMIAARTQPAVEIVLAATAEDFASGESSLFDGSGRLVNARSAALVNGTAAHAMDLDDIHPAMIGHPSAPLVPAVLALAEQRGSSGREVITALVAGYEVQCRIGAAGMPSHYLRGFHPTGTAATFGVAAAASRLLGLDADRTELALGIAGAQAAGLKSMFGTMSKPLHSGKAATNGILAAKLAAGGFTSVRDVLGVSQGFFAAEADETRHDIVRAPFGSPWYTLGIVLKLHAACGYTHPAIEAMLAIRERVTIDEVESIHLLVNPELLTAAYIDVPTTPLEAKFSVSWVSAMALLHGSVAASDFTEALLHDESIARLAKLVSITPDAKDGVSRLATITTVITRDGDRLVAQHDSSRPLWQQHPDEQRERLRNKFAALVNPVPGGHAAKAADLVTGRLRTVPNVRSLVRALASHAGPANNGSG